MGRSKNVYKILDRTIISAIFLSALALGFQKRRVRKRGAKKRKKHDSRFDLTWSWLLKQRKFREIYKCPIEPVFTASLLQGRGRVAIRRTL